MSFWTFIDRYWTDQFLHTLSPWKAVCYSPAWRRLSCVTMAIRNKDICWMYSYLWTHLPFFNCSTKLAKVISRLANYFMLEQRETSLHMWASHDSRLSPQRPDVGHIELCCEFGLAPSLRPAVLASVLGGGRQLAACRWAAGENCFHMTLAGCVLVRFALPRRRFLLPASGAGG